MFELIVVLASDGKEFDILMAIFVLPFVDSVLRDLSFGAAHLDFIFLCVWVLFMLVVVLKAINEAGAVGLGWLSHQGVDDSVLDLKIIFLIVLDQKGVLEKLVEYLISCDPFEKSMAIGLGFLESISLQVSLLHLFFGC